MQEANAEKKTRVGRATPRGGHTLHRHFNQLGAAAPDLPAVKTVDVRATLPRQSKANLAASTPQGFTPMTRSRPSASPFPSSSVVPPSRPHLL